MNLRLAVLLICSFCLSTLSLAQNNAPNRVEKNGMIVSWQMLENDIQITMTAPTDGWVAIGLNPKNQLAGSSFMMGRVVDGKGEVVDFYTIKPGDVHPVEKLGGKTAVGQVKGAEYNGNTSITFNLDANPGGDFHHKLSAGSTFFMHIAYSQDDDFAHHSMMRTVVEIRL